MKSRSQVINFLQYHTRPICIIVCMLLLLFVNSCKQKSSTGGVDNSMESADNSTSNVENPSEEDLEDIDCSEFASDHCDMTEFFDTVIGYINSHDHFEFLPKTVLDDKNQNISHNEFLKRRFGDIDKIEYTDDPNQPICGLSKLAWAAYLKDFSCFKSLIEQGADVSPIRNFNFHQTIHFIFYNSDKNVAEEYCFLKSIIDAGADINAVDTIPVNGTDNFRHQTVLDRALDASYYDDHYRIAKYLLKMGADAKKGSPLYNAVVKPDLDMIIKLIKAGADPNAGYTIQSGSNFYTLNSPLMAAAVDGCGADNYMLYINVVKLLIDAGADPMKRVQYLTPLCRAFEVADGRAKSGKGLCSEYLIKLMQKGMLYPSINAKCEFKFIQQGVVLSPLDAALRRHYDDIARVLIALGAD